MLAGETLISTNQPHKLAMVYNLLSTRTRKKSYRNIKNKHALMFFGDESFANSVDVGLVGSEGQWERNVDSENIVSRRHLV